MVSAVGFISGGLFNPAVTLGFLVTRRIAPLLAVCYWLVQFGAAALAALLAHVGAPDRLRRTPASSACRRSARAIGSGAGVVVEAVLTFFLVWVVFATAVDQRGAFKQIAGLAIGFTIAFDVLMAYGLTGGAMNPARAFGPQLVGRPLGAILGLVHRPVRGRGDRRRAVRAALPAPARPSRSVGRDRARRAAPATQPLLVPVGSGPDALDDRTRRRRPVHGHKIGLATVGGRVHRLRADLVVRPAAPQPELPGQRPRLVRRASASLFFVAMLSAVLVFGREAKEAGGGGEQHDARRRLRTTTAGDDDRAAAQRQPAIRRPGRPSSPRPAARAATR